MCLCVCSSSMALWSAQYIILWQTQVADKRHFWWDACSKQKAIKRLPGSVGWHGDAGRECHCTMLVCEAILVSGSKRKLWVAQRMSVHNKPFSSFFFFFFPLAAFTQGLRSHSHSRFEPPKQIGQKMLINFLLPHDFCIINSMTDNSTGSKTW